MKSGCSAPADWVSVKKWWPALVSKQPKVKHIQEQIEYVQDMEVNKAKLEHWDNNIAMRQSLLSLNWHRVLQDKHYHDHNRRSSYISHDLHLSHISPFIPQRIKHRDIYETTHTKTIYKKQLNLASYSPKSFPMEKKTAVVTSDYHSPHRAFARRAATAPVLYSSPQKRQISVGFYSI